MEKPKGRKAEIIEMAMHLFQKKGYEETTIVDICEQLRITRSSFYYHFASKEAVLDDYFHTTVLEINEHLVSLLNTGSSYEQFLRIFQIYMDRTIAWGPDLFAQVIKRFVDGKNQLLSPEHIPMKEVYVALLEQAQSTKEIANDTPAKLLVEQIVFLAVGTANYWCNVGGNFRYADTLTEMIALLLKPTQK